MKSLKYFVFMALVMLPSLAFAQVPGDLNNDNAVTPADLQLFQQVRLGVAGAAALVTGDDTDLNDDGVTNNLDFALLSRALNGLPVIFRGPANLAAAPGDTVTFVGLNFAPVAANNVVTVNGAMAIVAANTMQTNLTTLANATSTIETSLDVTIPLTAADGPLAITIGGQTFTIPEFRITTLASVMASSGTEGSDATVTVTLDRLAIDDITVTVSTAVTGVGVGNAVSGTDFTALSTQTVTVTAGQLTGTTTVATIDDDIVERDETFNVMLDANSAMRVGFTPATTAVGIMPGGDVAVITLSDNDIAEVDFTNPTGTGTEGTDDFPVSLTLNIISIPGGMGVGSISEAVDVTLAQIGGGMGVLAVPADFTDLQIGTFPANAVSGAMTGASVDLVGGDNLVEGPETLRLGINMLAPATLASVGTTQTFTDIAITDGDAASVEFAIANTITVTEGGGVSSPSYRLTTTPNTAVLAVGFTISPIAVAPNDTDIMITGATFMANDGDNQLRQFTVQAVDDMVIEGQETGGTVSAGTPPATASFITVGAVNSKPVTINDNDTATIQFTAATQNPSEAVGMVTVGLQMTTSPAGATLSADLMVTANVSGTAAGAGTDFTTTPMVTFTSGAGNNATESFMITIVDDMLIEDAETIILALNGGSFNPALATAGGQNMQTITISENESAVVDFTMATSSNSETAGAVGVSYTLTTTPATATLSAGENVLPMVTGGTAMGAGTDFNAPTAAAFLATSGNGATASASYTIVNDTIVEPDETITFSLGAPSTPLGLITAGSTITTHTATITEDDTAMIEFTTASSMAAENSGTADVSFTLTTSGGSTLSEAAMVTLGATMGTAAPGDFSAGAVTDFAIGAGNAATTTFTVTLTGDDSIEPDETAIFTLASIAPTYITTTNTPANHTLTITNDDGTASIDFMAGTSSNPETVMMAPVMVALTTSLPSKTLGFNASVIVEDAGSGAAATPADYTFTPATVAFMNGDGLGASAQRTINVTVADDNDIENAETVDLRFQAASLMTAGPAFSALVTVGGTLNTHTKTIEATDEATIQFTMAGVSNAEGADTVNTPIMAIAQLSLNGFNLTVPVNTIASFDAASTATNNDDIQNFTGVGVGFAATASDGDTVPVTITIVGDDNVEPDETAIITLVPLANNPVNTGGTPSFTLTITDDDGAPAPTIMGPTSQNISAAAFNGTGGMTTLTFANLTATNNTVDVVVARLGASTGGISANDAGVNWLALIPGGATSNRPNLTNAQVTSQYGTVLFNDTIAAVPGDQFAITVTVTNANGASTPFVFTVNVT